MWNSNSLTAWLLSRRGHDPAAPGLQPPAHGRAPGWSAGLIVAARANAAAAAHQMPCFADRAAAEGRIGCDRHALERGCVIPPRQLAQNAHRLDRRPWPTTKSSSRINARRRMIESSRGRWTLPQVTNMCVSEGPDVRRGGPEVYRERHAPL